LKCSMALQASLEALGMSLYVQPEARLNSVVGITMPGNVDTKQLLKTMSERYRVEIAGSFGPRIVRIGQMGEQCRAHNLFRTIHAFGSSMNKLGAKVDLPAAMATLESHLEYE